MGCQNSKVRTEEAAQQKPAAAPQKPIVAAPAQAPVVEAAVAAPTPKLMTPKADDTPVANFAVAVAAIDAAPAMDATVADASPMPAEDAPVAPVDAAEIMPEAAEVAVAETAEPEQETALPVEVVEMAAVVVEEPAAAVEAAPAVAEVQEAPKAAEPVVEVPACALKPALRDAATAASNRRVGFAAPAKVAAPVVEQPTRLNSRQRSMVKSGHVSRGRRAPVASKHSRCTNQMQADKYLEMVNAFERLLTNVHTCDAHLDSR